MKDLSARCLIVRKLRCHRQTMNVLVGEFRGFIEDWKFSTYHRLLVVNKREPFRGASRNDWLRRAYRRGFRALDVVNNGLIIWQEQSPYTHRNRIDHAHHISITRCLKRSTYVVSSPLHILSPSKTTLPFLSRLLTKWGVMVPHPSSWHRGMDTRRWLRYFYQKVPMQL